MARTQTPKKDAKEVTKKSPKSKKGEKGEKIKRKQKVSAYKLFWNEQFPIHRESNSELKLTEITKLIAADWRDLDANAKMPYQKQADEKNASPDAKREEASEEGANEEVTNEEGGNEQ